MEVQTIALAVLVLVSGAAASGAGRAFPIQSENYAIELFGDINRNIEWDYTNFLIDLAGNYANCRYKDTSGFMSVDQGTPDGQSIQAIVDNTYGDGVYVEDVNEYIRKILDSWMLVSSYQDQIRNADVFGCSVRPACSGKAVVACLFTPGYQSEQPDNLEDIEARAFTAEQYDMAEAITGHKWDRSYFLENLSGQETSCSMLRSEGEWPFTRAHTVAGQRGMRVSGLYGTARNHGETQPAMERILQGFKTIPSAVQVGCSLIADCRYGYSGDTHAMYVVVSCVYEE